jgi:hypothetical protein
MSDSFPDLRKGIPCVYMPCSQCDGARAHSVRYIDGARPDMRYALECAHCGSGHALTLTEYQQFGMMGDDFASLEAGKMPLEIFESGIPDEARAFLASRGYTPIEPASPKRKPLLREDIDSAPAARFSNSAGSGLIFAFLAGGFAYLLVVLFVDAEDVPAFLRDRIEHAFVADSVTFVTSFLAFGATFTLKLLHFAATQPRSMLVTPRGIEIKYATKRRSYRLKDVEWVGAGSGATSAIALRFNDKRVVKFDSDMSATAKLSKYFRGI